MSSVGTGSLIFEFPLLSIVLMGSMGTFCPYFKKWNH